MFWIIYVVSVIYCFYQLVKRYRATDLRGGGLDSAPGLDAIMVLFLAPVLAVVDVSLTWIRLYKEAEEVRRSKNKIEINLSNDDIL
jgi:predicted DNA-binding protein (UPF0278 family)